MTVESVYDIVILGGGPAGMSAALTAARASRRTLVLDQGIQRGAIGLARCITNYPGIPEPLSGEELIRRMREQAAWYGAQCWNAEVIETVLGADPKRIMTADGAIVSATVVILATGGMRRAQLVPGEREWFGRGVSYSTACDGACFKGRNVLVYGATEQAAEGALALTRYASMVYLTSPKPAFDITQRVYERVAAAQPLTLLMKTRLKAIEGNGAVSAVTLLTVSGERRLPVEGVFLFTQSGKPITAYLDHRVTLTPQGCVQVHREMATSVPGVFACGDVLYTDVQQAVIAAGQGCTAALAADRYLSTANTDAAEHTDAQSSGMG